MDVVVDWGGTKSMKNIVWKEWNPPEYIEFGDRQVALFSMALCDNSLKELYNDDKYDEFFPPHICGWNGMLEGDWVLFQGEKHRIVVASRMGDFGLSKTGKLPYYIRVAPDEIKPIKE